MIVDTALPQRGHDPQFRTDGLKRGLAHWNREALRAMVTEDLRRAVSIAGGALIGLLFGTRSFARHRVALWAT